MSFYDKSASSSQSHRGGSDPSPATSDDSDDGSSLDQHAHKHTSTSSPPSSSSTPAPPLPSASSSSSQHASGFSSPWNVPPSKPSFNQHPPHPSGWDLSKLPSSASTPLPLQLISTALSIGPTLLPAQLASLISALSLATKISLRATAFFIEVILESGRYGTSVGLGLTRRALISAVGSARTFYVVREGLDWAGGKVGGLTGSGDAFLNVLDKYTNLGIYIITHTLTLAELFAMSGFYLTSTTLRTGIAAAQESVSLFDGIFGSNETSRALASIITLVRKEVPDERFAERKKGNIKSLTALTKALTAFACLQNSTWKRTNGVLKQKVLFDCTVVGEVDQDFDISQQDGLAQLNGGFHSENGERASAGSRNRYPQPSPDNSYLLTDVRSAKEQQDNAEAGPSSASSRRQSRNPFGPTGPSSPNSNDAEGGEDESDDDIIWELEKLVGEDPDEVLEGDERSRRRVSRLGGRGRRSSDAYYEITEQVTESVTETQTVEHYNLSDLQQSQHGQPALRNRTQPSSSSNPQQAVLLEDEWVEVDNVVNPPYDATSPESSSPSPMQLISSSPNGSSENPTVASAAYRDALEHPQANSLRVQVILKTTIKKLLEKKRIVRRVPPEPNASPDGSSRRLQKPDPRSLSWNEDEAEEVESMMGGGTTSADSSPGPSRSISAAPSLGLNPVHAHAPPPSGSVNGRPSTMRPSLLPRGGSRDEEGGSLDGKKHGSFSRAISKAKSSLSGKTSAASSPSSTPTKSPPRLLNSAARNVGSPTSKSRSLSSPPLRDGALHPTRSTSPNRSTAHHPLFVPHPSDPNPSSESSSPTASSNSFPSVSSTGTARPRPARRPSSPEEPKHHSDSSHPPNRLRVPLNSPTAPKRKAPRLRQPSTTTSTRSVLTQQSQFQTTTQAGPSNDESHLEGLFPRDHLIKNIHKFCRYSSAAYGQNFLRILGLGATEFMFPTTGRHHANSWAFAHHTNLPIDALLLSSYVDPGPAFAEEKLSPLVHYIAVDHAAQAIVLTCRGTLGLSDVLVDLTCEYEAMVPEGGDPEASYLAHGGMLYSAKKLMASKSTVHETIRQALIAHPTYGLVLTGHSLGGGVASLLSILWSCPVKYFLANFDAHPTSYSYPPISTPFVTNFSSGLPPGRPIHCYVYGPPCVASSDLARHTRGLITSVVQGNDIVPSLSLGVLHDFKNVAVTLSDEGNVAEEIVGRVVGIYQRRLREKYGPALLNGSTTQPTIKSLQEAESNDHPQVSITPSELAQGHSRNYAEDPTYRDPTLEDKSSSSDSESTPEADEQKSLDDWFLALIKTMRADMSNEKLYPAGRVYTMEHWTVFVTADLPKPSPNRGKPGDPKQFSHKEAHRVVLKLVEDVEKRFGEPVFSRSMLHDHLPSGYEMSTQLLYDGLFGGA
ncbi:hypothetical protein BDY24DRAFT_373037 [Mrakia frigida]|uniref:uncharacterized protein n=1 Tax=Mrakia frigida TaxID=29902 RepID=UPI003FCBFCF4